MPDPGRHGRPMSLVSRSPVRSDRDRDLAAVVSSGIDWRRDCPWLLQRWSQAGVKMPRRVKNITGAPSKRNFDESKSDSSGKARSRNQGDGESSEVRAAKEQQDQVLLQASGDRFDPKCIDIECDLEPLKASIAAIVGDENTGIPIFADYCEAVDDASKSDDECVEVFCKAANGLGRHIVGESYIDLIRANGKTHLRRNPRIELNEKHGKDDWDEKSRDVRPGIVILRQGLDVGQDLPAIVEDWSNVIATGEMRRDIGFDTRTMGRKDETLGLCMLKNLTSLARNHPISGRTYGLTLTGKYLRFWVSDSLSFATSQLCDLSNPDHAADIAKILAFLMGKVESIIDTYEPPRDVFNLEVPGRKEPEIWRWCSASGESINDLDRAYTILEVRNELWGRRTAVFAGYAQKQDDDSKQIYPIAIKCAWLPPYLEHYERKILQHVHDALDCTDPEKYPYLAKARGKVDPRVIELIPKPLGTLSGCERKSRDVVPVFADEDGLAVGSGEALYHLKLSVLVTSNPHGERVPSEPTKLSLRQHWKILRNAAETLWIVSCCDVHYRDINLGNILFEVIWIGGEMMVTGFLIDYGNARIKDERRKKADIDHPLVGGTVELCLDDARSINAYFICTHMAETLRLAETHKKRGVEIKDLEGSATLSDDVKALEILRVTKERDDLVEEIKLRKHRYIDDFESLLYAFCFWVAAMWAAAKARMLWFGASEISLSRQTSGKEIFP